MEFRDLKAQYQNLKLEIDRAIQKVLDNTNFISGKEIKDLEKELAEYVGVKHCITCANGTDALVLALKAWGIGQGDAVFVPDFTFFASAEAPAVCGATPIFVDVDKDTFNISPDSLEEAIQCILKEGKMIPKVVVAVDLFGQPADYKRIREIANKKSVILLQNAFPILEKYIDHPHMLNGKPLKVVDVLKNEILDLLATIIPNNLQPKNNHDIAHRGSKFNGEANDYKIKDNSLEAFINAGENGFWGKKKESAKRLTLFVG